MELIITKNFFYKNAVKSNIYKIAKDTLLFDFDFFSKF
jgi:hypothetical protein